MTRPAARKAKPTPVHTNGASSVSPPNVFDFTAAKQTVADDEAGRTFAPLAPDGTPYVNPDGTPLTLTVAGYSSRRYREANQATGLRWAAQGERDPNDLDALAVDLLDAQINLLVHTTSAWTLTVDGVPVPCELENIQTFYASAPDIARQAREEMLRGSAGFRASLGGAPSGGGASGAPRPAAGRRGQLAPDAPRSGARPHLVTDAHARAAD